MISEGFFYAAPIPLVLAVLAIKAKRMGVVIIAIGCALALCFASYLSSEQYALLLASHKKEVGPKVIHEADGCKVYEFNANGAWHYFTRCPDSATNTETVTHRRIGNQTRVETQSIEVKP